VADGTLAKVDSRSRFIGAMDDAFSYKGRVYSDLFYGEPEYRRKRDGVIYLLHFFRYGAGRICRFHYYDPSLTFTTTKNK